MNGTPRLRSAFPATPQTNARSSRYGGYGGSPGHQRSNQNIPTLNSLKPSARSPEIESDPLIPAHIIDPPSQRFYAFAIYIALFTYRIWDWSTLQDSEEQSLWLFMKWVFTDGVFLFGLPALRIPWLQWDSATILLLFCGHALLDGMLMFQISLPVGAAFSVVGRGVWGAYEMAVNEHSVNPQSVWHNESLILGRQIIHILPEGSAVLNQEREAFCVDSTRTEARLPITINATNPISIDLLRIDLDTQANETIHISKSQIKTMHREASRLLTYSEDPSEPKTLYHSVKKPGLYVLQKVMDETNLEVSRRRLAHTVVVPCPKASVKHSIANKCKGEIGDVDFEVSGTPPLRVKYTKVADYASSSMTAENIQPDDFFSPLSKQDPNALVVPARVDTEWARIRTVQVPMSEHLAIPGDWAYTIEEIQDGFGNRVDYTDPERKDRSQRQDLRQIIKVHERPSVNLQGCTSQKPLKVAKGKTADLPVQYGSLGRGSVPDAPHHLQYIFTPDASLSPNGEHSSNPSQQTFTVKDSRHQPQIKEPGLYTLTGVSTDFCKGEVMEPRSCLLSNPPEPDLAITTEEIFDKCAGSPIGLRVDLDLVGTPPFKITYKMTQRGKSEHEWHSHREAGHRGQLELRPTHAGHYTYEFLEIKDAVYKAQPFKNKDLKLEQDVKPSASANFINLRERYTSCIDETVDFEVTLQGEGPFSIEYELLHAGKRNKFQLENIENAIARITTPRLTSGGEYTVALATVTDRMGCKEFLKDEAKISVRHQKPSVGFGTLDGQRTVSVKEGESISLPLRMSGDAPWTIQYVDAAGVSQKTRAQHANDQISVRDSGVYELVDLKDAICPGQVDEKAKRFEVSMVPRPEMSISSEGILEEKGTTFVKDDVCEGDEDAFEVLFKGSPAYRAHYTQSVKLRHGTMSPKEKEIKAALNSASVRMDTGQAGLYEYKFTKIRDANYEHSSRHFTPQVVKQQVHAKPSAKFKNPGKTYSFCSVESEGEEVIPVELHGTPPFSLEVEIKHHGAIRPETVMLNDVPSTSTNIRIPHHSLHQGKSSVALRRVSDSRGCSRTLDLNTPRVQVSVHDAPTIVPIQTQEDFCVGDRLGFSLTGAAPFDVFYTFEGHARKANVRDTTFRRLAEKPGTFSITGVQDSASQCRATTSIIKHIHGMPSVRVSKGKESYVDIHEGGEAEILFEFGGVPPFEFTYTRSSNAEKGKRAGVVLDMKSEISEDYSMRIRAHEEGTYEVVAIKDKHCSYAKQGVNVGQKSSQKKLGYH